MKIQRIASISGIVVSLLLLTATGVGADDGWRRTAQGWEHSSAWESPAVTVVEVSPVPTMHPLHLAITQVVASTLALAFFAPNRTG